MVVARAESVVRAESDPPSPGMGPPAPPMATGLRARLVSGAAAVGLSLGVWTVLQILAVPVFVGAWGTAVYGQWLALVAATSLLSLLDLGLQVHMTNLMRAAAAQGNHQRLEEVIADALGLYSGAILLGGLGLGGVVLFGDVPGWLGVTAPDASLACLLLGSTTLLLVPRGLIGCVFSARGQLPREAFLSSAQQVVPLAAQMAVVLGGGGLSATAAAFLVANLLVGWGVLLLAFWHWHGDVRLRVRWPGLAQARRYLWRASLFNVAGGAGALTISLPVILLQTLAPAGSAVVTFTTMRTFAGLLRQTVASMAVVSALEMTRQYAQGDGAGLIRLFTGTSRIISGAAGLVAAPMMVLGPGFFVLWTHGTLPFDPLLAAILIGSVPVMACGQCALAVLRHTDHAEPLVWFFVAQAGAGGLLCLILCPGFGAHGAAIAVTVSELAGLGWPGLRTVRQKFGVAAFRTLMFSWASAAAGFALGTVVAAALRQVLPSGSLVELLDFGVAWGVVVALPAIFVVLPARQRQALWSRLRTTA